ncbi:hypothetical protein H8D36_03385 [archaeon]|nr:hypothetical protein [archaeon]
MKKRWSQYEVAILRRYSSWGYSDKQVSMKLGRSEKSVRAKRNSLRITIKYHRIGLIEKLWQKIKFLFGKP